MSGSGRILRFQRSLTSKLNPVLRACTLSLCSWVTWIRHPVFPSVLMMSFARPGCWVSAAKNAVSGKSSWQPWIVDWFFWGGSRWCISQAKSLSSSLNVCSCSERWVLAAKSFLCTISSSSFWKNFSTSRGFGFASYSGFLDTETQMEQVHPGDTNNWLPAGAAAASSWRVFVTPRSSLIPSFITGPLPLTPPPWALLSSDELAPSQRLRLPRDPPPSPTP